MWICSHTWGLLYVFSENPARMWTRRRPPRSTIRYAYHAKLEAARMLATFSVLLRFYLLLYLLIPQLFTVGGSAPDAAWLRTGSTLRRFIHCTRHAHRNICSADAHTSTCITRRHYISKGGSSGSEQHSSKSNVSCGCTAGKAFLIQLRSRRAVLVKGSCTCWCYSLGCNSKQEGYKIVFSSSALTLRGKEEEPRMHTQGELAWCRRNVLQRRRGDGRASRHAVAFSCRPCIGGNRSDDTEAPSPKRRASGVYTLQNVCACVWQRRTTPTALRHQVSPQERRSRLPEGGGQPGYICCWQLYHSALPPAGAAEIQRHGVLWMDRWNQRLAAARRREATEWSATAAGTSAASGRSSAIPTATFTAAAEARQPSRRVPPIRSTPAAETAAVPRSLGRSGHVQAAPAEAAAAVVAEAPANCYRRQTTLRAASLAATTGKHGQGLAVDPAHAATTRTGSGTAAAPGLSYGDVRTVDSKLLGGLWHCGRLYPNVSGKREGVRCADSFSPPRGEQSFREAEAADTIYALSSMGDTTEFSPAAIAVWRISGPLAFLVLRLLMAKPLPASSRQGQERGTNHQHGKHHQNAQELRHDGQQQVQWHAQQREQQEEREQAQHGLEFQGEEGKKHERQQARGEKTLHHQPRDNLKVLRKDGQHRQLPFLLRPLPEERVATFVKAWDCLDSFWEPADIAPSTVAGPAGGAPRAAAAAPSAVPLDDIVVLRFSSPRSFTGEDVVEVHSHGSRAAVRAIRQFFGRVAELIGQLQQQQEEEKEAEETQEHPLEGEEDDQEYAGGQMEECVIEEAIPTTVEEAYTQFLQQQRLPRSPPLHSGEAPAVSFSAAEEHRPHMGFTNDIVNGVRQESSSNIQRRGPGTEEDSCSGRCSTTGYDVLPRWNPGRQRRDYQRSQSQRRRQLLEFVKAVWIDMHAEQQDEQTPLEERGVLFPGKFRLATRGEFSLRAFLNGKLRDLHALRALAALVTAESTQQHQGALNQLRQPSQLVQQQMHQWQRRLQQALALIEGCVQIGDDESVADSVVASGWAPQVADELVEEVLFQIDQQHALLSREQEAATGLKVVICGPPNAGKSTLFNALLGRDAAIVSGRAGTTRDVLSAPLPLLHGKKALLYDTAGLHEEQRPEEQRRQQQTGHSEEQQQPDAFLQHQLTNIRQTGKEPHREKLLPRVPPVKPQHSVWSNDPVEQEGMVRAVRAGDAADVLLLMMEAHTSPQVTIDACRSFLRCFVAAAAAVRAAGLPATATASALATEQAEISQTAKSCRDGTDLREGDIEPNSSSPFSTVVHHHRPLIRETKSAASCFSQGSDVLLLPRVKRIYLLLNKAERLFADGSAAASLVGYSPVNAATTQNSLAARVAPGFAAEGASKFSGSSSLPAGGPADTAAIAGIPPSLGIAGDAAARGSTGVRTIVGGDRSTADADGSLGASCTAEVKSASVPAATLAALSRIGAEELPLSLFARVVPVTRVPVAVGRSSSPPGLSFHEQPLGGLVLPLSARCGWNLPLLLQMLEREVDSQQQQGLPPLQQQGARPVAPPTATLAAASAGVGQAAARAGRATGSMGDDCTTLYWRRGVNCADDNASAQISQTSKGTLCGAAATGQWDADSATNTEAAGEGNICGEFLVGRREVLRLLRAASVALRRYLQLPTTVVEEKAEELREALKSLQLLTGDEETGARHAVIKALLDTFCVGK